MDVQTLMQAVTTVGFPIVACGALGWLLYREQNVHKEEMNNMTTALNANTVIMTELKQLLEDIKNGI